MAGCTVPPEYLISSAAIVADFMGLKLRQRMESLPFWGIRFMKQAGGTALVVRSVDEVRAVIDGSLQ